MKRTLLFLIFGLLLINACKKDPVKGLDHYIYAQKNDNIALTAKSPGAGYKSVLAKDTLYISSTFGEDNLVIRLIPKGTGSYQTPDLDAVFYTTIGGDAVIKTYRLNNDPANILKITNLDQNTIQGTFDLTFKETTRGLTGTPATLTLTNGRLRSKIESSNYDNESFFRRF